MGAYVYVHKVQADRYKRTYMHAYIYTHIIYIHIHVHVYVHMRHHACKRKYKHAHVKTHYVYIQATKAAVPPCPRAPQLQQPED